MNDRINVGPNFVVVDARAKIALLFVDFYRILILRSLCKCNNFHLSKYIVFMY